MAANGDVLADTNVLWPIYNVQGYVSALQNAAITDILCLLFELNKCIYWHWSMYRNLMYIKLCGFPSTLVDVPFAATGL